LEYKISAVEIRERYAEAALQWLISLFHNDSQRPGQSRARYRGEEGVEIFCTRPDQSRMMGAGPLSGGESGWVMALSTHRCTALRLRMG